MIRQGQPKFSNPDGDQEKTNYLESSVLFQPPAIWLLIILLFTSVWFRFIPLIVISVFLSFLFILITIWKRLSLQNVKPNIHFSKTRLFAGEDFQINASVNNAKWLPLIWLEWVFPKSSGISFCNDNEDASTVRLLWLLPYQSVGWELTAKALARGVYDIGQVTLRSGDGFRFAETEESYHLGGKLYVYPRLMSVDVSDFRPSKQWGVKGKQGGFIEDPLLVTGIREYQSGDEIRRLNWRASVRTGKLQTNVYQPVVTEQLLIYVDVTGFEMNEEEYEDLLIQKEYSTQKKESFETFLAVIASVAVEYKKQGISLGFASNGISYNGEKMPGLLPSANLTPFLDQLAKITQRVGVPNMMALDGMMYKGRLSFPLYIFCHEVREEHYLWYEKNKHRLSETSFYFLRKTVYGEHLTGLSKSLDMFLSSLSNAEEEADHEAG